MPRMVVRGVPPRFFVDVDDNNALVFDGRVRQHPELGAVCKVVEAINFARAGGAHAARELAQRVADKLNAEDAAGTLPPT